MRTRRTTPRLLGACTCALTIIAATLVLLADPAAAASAPVVKAPSSRKTSTNVAVTLQSPTGISVSDADSPTLKLQLFYEEGTVPGVPLITLARKTGLTFLAGDGTNDDAVTVQGSVANINAALDGMSILPLGTGGTYHLVITASDAPSGSGSLAHTVGFPIVVTDDAPVVTAPPDLVLNVGSSVTTQAKISDKDSPQLEVTVSLSPTTAVDLARFSLGSTTGLTIVNGSATNSSFIRFHSTPAAAAAAMADITISGGATAATYQFGIRVEDALSGDPNVETDNSNVAVKNLPSAPTALKATPKDGAVSVTWAAPTSTGGQALTGYRVTRIDGGVAQAPFTVGPTILGTAFTALTNGTTYTVKVEALNAEGAGPPASATATPQGFVPFASAGAAVDRMYLDLLGRAPTAAERTTAIAAFAPGSPTGHLEDLVVALRTSAESSGTVDPVTRLYRAYLLRIPDAGGLNFWIKRKRNGTKLDSISQSFANSNEFKTRYGNLTNQAFVELIYHNLFDRDGDAAGIAFWTKQLDTGKRTRGRVMTGFSESNEYKTKQAAEVEVSVLYTFLLGRAPKLDEFTFFVDSLDQAADTPRTLARQLVQEAEYANRVS